MEMEGDFEGDLFDLPSDEENEDEEGEQDEKDDQRLDQEMGDVGQEGQVCNTWAPLVQYPHTRMHCSWCNSFLGHLSLGRLVTHCTIKAVLYALQLSM